MNDRLSDAIKKVTEEFLAMSDEELETKLKEAEQDPRCHTIGQAFYFDDEDIDYEPRKWFLMRMELDDEFQYDGRRMSKFLSKKYGNNNMNLLTGG